MPFLTDHGKIMQPIKKFKATFFNTPLKTAICWTLAADLILWRPSHGRGSQGRARKSYIDQLADGTGCRAGELANAMSDRESWRGRVTESRDSST